MTTDNKAQDSAFYTDDTGSQVVWTHPNKHTYIARVGEMRIHYTDANGDQHTLRYTSDLADLGITTDEALAEFTAKGEEVFDWVNNSWFEIFDDREEFDLGEVHHSLDEAIAEATQIALTKDAE
jgi:hypothetical protein